MSHTKSVFCRISQPPSPEPPALVSSTGELEGVTNPEPGVYHVSLAAGYAFVPPVSLQVSATDKNVTVGGEIKQEPNGSYYIAVHRWCGGQPENGDVWLTASGIEVV